ncbi:MAG: type III-A CRISPR-associated RAMP protein Csm5 [Peptostreptococcaceae bacterium]|nr:type III-A CRISPR-associated RAMP protein Csm5 [Peptostreptococcaceae bacterium]
MANIKKYKMSLNVITALHVGGSEHKSVLKSNEYICDELNRTLYLIDENKFMQFLSESDLLDKYIEYIHRNVYQKRNQQDKVAGLYTFLEENRSLNKIERFLLSTYEDVDVDNEIKLFIRDAYNQPYIPGSSIKGAIVNSLLVDHLIKDRDRYSSLKNTILKEAKEVTDQKLANSFRKSTSNRIKEVIDKILYYYPSRKIKQFGLSVSDSYASENISSDFLQDHDEHRLKKEDPKPIPLCREYLMPGSKLFFDLTLDIDLLEKTPLKIQNAKDILKAVENASEYLTQHTLNVNKEYDLILGANTGFHQKTIIHALFDKKDELLQVTKALLHKKDPFFGSNRSKDKKAKKKTENILVHLNDRISPRVINRVDLGNFELAGVVQLVIMEEKHVGEN